MATDFQVKSENISPMHMLKNIDLIHDLNSYDYKLYKYKKLWYLNSCLWIKSICDNLFNAYEPQQK